MDANPQLGSAVALGSLYANGGRVKSTSVLCLFVPPSKLLSREEISLLTNPQECNEFVQKWYEILTWQGADDAPVRSVSRVN